MIKPSDSVGPGAEPQPEPPSVAQEVLAAIRMAREEERSCEAVVDLRLAAQFLKKLGYPMAPCQKGFVVRFPRAAIYFHE